MFNCKNRITALLLLVCMLVLAACQPGAATTATTAAATTAAKAAATTAAAAKTDDGASELEPVVFVFGIDSSMDDGIQSGFSVFDEITRKTAKRSCWTFSCDGFSIPSSSAIFNSCCGDFALSSFTCIILSFGNIGTDLCHVSFYYTRNN